MLTCEAMGASRRQFHALKRLPDIERNERMIASSVAELAQSPDTLKQLRDAAANFCVQARQNPTILETLKTSPIDAFLANAPAELRDSFPEAKKAQANAVLNDVDVVKSDVAQAVKDDEARGWGSTFCQIGLWAAIVAAIGGAIAISQGAAIAPLLAMDAGLLPVLAAITGLSEGAISALAAGGGLTFSKLIDAACE